MSKFRRVEARREISRRLKEARLAAGLRQEDVAKVLRLDRRQWMTYEHGDTSIPAERLCDVARALDTTTAYLLGGN